MRSRTIKMIATAVTVAVLILGIPAIVVSSMLVWNSEENVVQMRTQTIGNAIERRITEGQPLVRNNDDLWARSSGSDVATMIRIYAPGHDPIVIGKEVMGPRLRGMTVTTSGATVRIEQSAKTVGWRIFRVCLAYVGGIVVSLAAGWWLALRGSRQISAPLIYLAAQAEQIGAGQVRARVRPSGIEEIDLVQEELARTGERMAGRLAAERQFASNASHQLRTPLTALSMRLEEIELTSDDDHVRTEAHACLEQVDRLTQVVSDLLAQTKQAGANTEAVHVLEVFNQQREEWESAFEAQGRELVFKDEAAQPVLADPSILSQALATLIENSLNYGDGTTRVVCRPGTSSRSVFLVVSDEGEGVGEDLQQRIFEKGVSGHGSTGIGLPLARSLVQSAGGRLELTDAPTAEFTISLAAMPASLDPDVVMPQGPLVSVGRRSRRL
ncbi:ATP-binding protein [Gleimia hominis]|uniref:ATP-binding protein n=1 Tax=Gleimia hominis TaxID=595468 RepID=UPI000C7FDF54|nr:ATP-binding protein [Gleimia hominis]WIK64758.1 ATP-binding protein [Gleimia hominis]